MSILIVDPAKYPDWDRRVLLHPDYSVFHSLAWCRTLVDSYGFQPVYFIVSGQNGFDLLLPLMEIKSRLTGTRGVSLPFTDQCPICASDMDRFAEGVRGAIRSGEDRRWRYIEWRDVGHFSDELQTSEQFHIHDIDLRKPEGSLYLALSDNNRRNIKKAQREGLTVRIGVSNDDIEGFYRLNIVTRKRHGLPPQPFVFFKNVYEHLLSKGHGIVITAMHKGRAIASSIFFHMGRKAIYKYGASDLAYQSLRPNNLVMWEALTWYSSRGFESLNLGRTEMSNPGLLQFKRTWGGREQLVKYRRYDFRKKEFVGLRAPANIRFERIFSRMPTGALRLIGQFFYKHVG